MRTVITTAVLSVALLGAAGCAENAGVRDDSDRYVPPPPAARGGQTSGNTNHQDLTLQAQPAAAEIRPSDEPQPPTLNPNMPSGNTVQPGGVQHGVPGTTARNPGTVPPTVPSGGNTAGAAGR